MYRRAFTFMFAIGLLLLSALACGGGDPNNFVSYEADYLSISLEHPETWAIEEDSESITLANSSSNLNAEEIRDGAGVAITGGALADFGGFDDPVLLTGLVAQGFVEGSNADVVSEAEALTINGNSAAKVRIEGEIDFQDGSEPQEGVYDLYVIIAGDSLILVIGIDASSDGEFGDAITRISESIAVRS